MVLYSKYSVYRGSGESWIGEIPEKWKVERLKFCVDLRNEKVIADDSLTYVGLENIVPRTGKLVEGELFTQDEEMNVEGVANAFYTGDILFGKLRPYLAKCVVAAFNGKCTTELLVIKTKGKKVHNRYLGYLMLSNEFIELINSSTYGSKMPRANWGFIGDQKIPLLPYSDQIQIANFLDKKTAEIDSLITDKEKLIELLEDQCQAIITETVTKGFYPDVKMKQADAEWIGEIPKHWEIKRLKDCCYINPNKSEIKISDEIDVTFLPMENITSTGCIDTSVVKEISTVYNGYTYFKEDDIVVAKVTPCFENKNIAIAKGLCNGIGFGTTELHVLRANKYTCNKFIYFLLQSNRFMLEGVASMYGVAGLKRIPTEFIQDFKFAIPDYNTQLEIATYLEEKTNQLSEVINEIQSQIEKLKEYRQALIYEAVTGKIDVRNEGKETDITA